MYYCYECGALFEDPVTYEERDTDEGGYGNVMYREDHCPNCDSDDIDEATECPICGEHHGSDGRTDICTDCQKEIQYLWGELMKQLPKDVDEDDIKTFIAEVME